MKIRLLMVFLCAALLAGCGGLAGEPPIVSTLPPSTPAPTDIGHPLAPPDIARGATVFAENCTRCHGVAGKGDGEFVQSGQITSPGDFTSAATSADARPVDWYTTISDGNTTQLMPPWRDTLSEADRWAVAMYTYTLGMSQAQIAHGHDLFTANCAGCDTSSFSDLTAMATFSQDVLYGQVSAMPAFAKLSEADRRDVTAYVRTLTLASVDSIGSAPQQVAQATVEAPSGTPEVSPASTAAIGAASTAAVATTSGAVSGQVTNGTAGSAVPPNLPITLYIFDASLNQQQKTATAGADGSYSFADVPFDATDTYVITTNYRNHVFASDLLSGDALKTDMADGALSLPLKIYELTEDADVVQISGMVTQVSVVGDSMQVAQVFDFKNTSDRAFTTSQTTSDGRSISLAITLPPGAVVASTANDQNRYVIDQTNFTVFDTIPVVPNEDDIVHIIYLIPYSNGGAIIEQPMNYAVNGQVRLLVQPTSLQVTSQQLPIAGPQTVSGTTYETFGGQLALKSGDVLRYELSGAGMTSAQAASQGTVVSSNNLLVLVIGVLVIAALVGGGLFLIGSRNRRPRPAAAGISDQQVIDVLIRQIAELDADHEARKIDDDAYERQRSALKARLTALIERKK